jgi:hypothetical protein
MHVLNVYIIHYAQCYTRSLYGKALRYYINIFCPLFSIFRQSLLVLK